MLKMEVGWVIETTAAINLEPHTIIQPGERGTVVYSDETGRTDIRMHTFHKGLVEWDNCMWLIPPYTDTLEMALRIIQKVTA